jgi:hypothetical protein
MHTYRIVWEDEPKAREIEILVHYRLDGGQVEIDAVRPTQVTLFADHTPQPTRVLPVHTAAGRRLLAQAYLAARESAASIEEEILAAHEKCDEAVAVACVVP